MHRCVARGRIVTLRYINGIQHSRSTPSTTVALHFSKRPAEKAPNKLRGLLADATVVLGLSLPVLPSALLGETNISTFHKGTELPDRNWTSSRSGSQALILLPVMTEWQIRKRH